jgi:hypothetical protein
MQGGFFVKKAFYTLLIVLSMAIFVVAFLSRGIDFAYNKNNYPCNAARQLVEQYFDSISAQFVQNFNRPHENVCVEQLTIGYGFKMVDIRYDLRDTFQKINRFEDIITNSNDWLFIINHNNKSRGHVIVRNILGEYKLYWPELYHSYPFNEYGGFEMSSRLFWHFDEIMERYSYEFDVCNMTIFNNISQFWLISHRNNVIELCRRETFGRIRRDEPLIMCGLTVAEIIKLNMQYFVYTLNQCYMYGDRRHNFVLNRNLYPLYLAYIGPVTVGAAPELRTNDNYNITLEVVNINGLIATVRMENYSPYDIFTGAFFSVDYFNDKEWLHVRPLRGSGAPVGLTIQSGETFYFHKNLLTVYPIEPGLYRIRKDFSPYNTPQLSYDVVAEFKFTGG